LAPTARSRDRHSPAGEHKTSLHWSAGRRKALTMVRMRSLVQSSVVVAILIAGAATRARADDLNDYPTSARADYVFGCMKANGETQELLQKCSCSIDVIASIIPYERYVTTETILSMSQVTGPVGSEFRSTEPARLAVQEFRRAQAEAEVRCF
jgi:sarcosine oxidase delta subunit